VTRAASVLRPLDECDRWLYGRVGRWSAPLLDEPLRKVSRLADFSKPWILVAGALGLLGGSRGRRAAVTGLAAVGTTSLLVNQPLKALGARGRPDRGVLGAPQPRWVRMPTSTAFPSGHAASAAAFAVAVGDLVPALRPVLGTAASVVAFSRVYTGVHYPSDVLVGAGVGALVGRLVGRSAARWGPGRT
jgi:undecaprenyl-diphosphatase